MLESYLVTHGRLMVKPEMQLHPVLEIVYLLIYD